MATHPIGTFSVRELNLFLLSSALTHNYNTLSIFSVQEIHSLSFRDKGNGSHWHGKALLGGHLLSGNIDF